MARTPTWAELRLDVARLIHLQKECYRSVHYLLDTAIPSLDEKISLLNGTKQLNHDSHLDKRLSPIKATNRARIPKSQSSQFPTRLDSIAEPHQNSTLDSIYRQGSFNNFLPDDISPEHHLEQTTNLHLNNVVEHSSRPEVVPIKPILVTGERRQKTNDSHKFKHDTAVPIQHQQPKTSKQTRDPSGRARKPKAESASNKQSLNHDDMYRLENLEHLKPLPMPLSEYFKQNRPHLVMRADRRVMYLRRLAERRKYLTTTRILNSLEQVRISSRSSSSNNLKRYVAPKDSYANAGPQYKVKCKLSEHEMKRLTAKTYKRLPEVKRRRKEELTNHMKVQNYKNRLEYGRKLTQNRRHGVINYPLRSLEYTDTSITSSQSEYSLNGNDRAADPFLRPTDPYY